MPVVLVFIVLLTAFLFLTFFAMLRRYRRCPSDRILVIYGKTGEGSARCIHGGAAFVWPLFQDYAYLDLTPISIEIPLQGALSRKNNEDVPRFIVDAAAELKGKGIVDEAAPCALFTRSFLTGSGESGGRDLVLLLKRTRRDVLRRLERWVGEQDNRTVTSLKDYLTTASFERKRML